MAKMKYITMREAHKIWLETFDSPKDPRPFSELAQRHARDRGVDCMPVKRGGSFTMSREQIKNLAKSVTPSKKKPGKRYGWKPLTDQRPPPHVEPWSWSKNIRQPVRRNWAASQWQRNES